MFFGSTPQCSEPTRPNRRYRPQGDTSYGHSPPTRGVCLPYTSGMTHHMFTTCGDDIGDCAAMWRSDIAARGWRSGRAFSVQMPNTYVTMRGFDVDSTETAQCKVSAMPAHVARTFRMAEDPCGIPLVRATRHVTSPVPRHRFLHRLWNMRPPMPHGQYHHQPFRQAPALGRRMRFLPRLLPRLSGACRGLRQQNKTQRAMAWNIKMPHFTLFV